MWILIVLLFPTVALADGPSTETVAGGGAGVVATVGAALGARRRVKRVRARKAVDRNAAKWKWDEARRQRELAGLLKGRVK